MPIETLRPSGWFGKVEDHARRYGPGFLVCAIVAIAGKFLTERYGASAMLTALWLGIAFHFLAEEGKCVAGIDLTPKKILRCSACGLA